MGYVLVNDDYKISDAALAGIDTASRYGKWYSYNKKVDFNTLQKDLEAVNQDVVAAYEGWQTQEKMKNIKSSAENMYNRLISLQEYNQLTNAANTEYIDAMVSDYKTVLESWDDRASIYGNYKNAEAYKTDLNNYIFGQQFRVKTGVDKETGEDIYRGYTYAEVQAELEKYEVGSDEYNYLKKYIGYTDLNEFDKAIEKENTSGIAKKVRDTERKKAGYDLRALNSRRGFSDVKNFITNGLSGNSVLNNIYRLPAYQPSAIAVLTDDTANETTTAEGNALITFEQVLKATEDTANETTTAEGNGLLTFEQMLKASEDKANAKAAYEKAVLNPSLAIDDYDWLLSKAKSTQEVIDSLKKTDEYKYYEDLEEARNQWELDHRADYYKHYMENEDFEEKSQYVSTVKDWDTYGLEVDGQYEYINNSFVVAGTMYTIGASTEEIRYKYLNEDEVKIYNYLYSTKGKDAAQDFLDNMEITLGYRDNVAMGKRLEAIADNPIGAVVGSVASVPLNIIGGTCSGIGNFVDWVFGEEYNPYADYNTLSNAVSSFRGYVSENIAEATEGFELLGTNVPSFLYDTGMSMADSALGAYTLGAHSSLIMGANAYQQKAKELYEAGEDEYTVSATAFATGFSEVLFEYVSIDKLLKIKDVDSISSLLKSGAKQAGIEASEEFFTELSNIIADDVIRGDSSELAQMARELRGKGYSESEINAELAKHIGSKLAWASIGGALSGGVMGSASSTKAYLNAKSIGNTISASNGINELLNMASLSSEESNSFNLYTVYVQKGINAKNITNAQIGIIYNALNTDTLNTLFSKTTTVAQKRNALTNQTKLQKISQRASISTDTMTAIDHALSMQEAYRANLNNLINTGISFKNTSKAYKLAKSCEQKISDGETITDSEINNLVNEIAIVRTEEYIENLPQKELFEKFYNKNTDVISFVNSFKYVRYLAQNKFSEKYILNHKGVLTEAQAKAVLDSVDLSYKKTHEHSDLDTKTDKDEISKDFNELINIINTLAADGNIFFDKIIDNEFIKTINNEISSRQETNNINTIQRKKLRQSIQNELSDMGSADIDIDGNVKYNGEVKQEYRVDLVIGLPGSGKSSTVAIPLSEKYKSKIIDIDMVKEKLPEYDNGLGASAVHLESVKIAKEIMAKAVAKGDNIVYQFVGGGKSPNSIINKIKMFKNNGYSVYLHLCDVSNDVALGRALERYIQTGRYISPEIIKNYADTPSQNFDKIVNTTNLLDGYERHFNNQMTDKGELYYERESEQAKPTEPYNQDEKEIDGNDNGTASQADTIGGKFDGEAFKKSNKSIDGRGFDNGRIPGEGRSIPLQEAVTEIEQSEQSSLESDSVNGSVFYSQENKQEDVSSYEKSASHHENGALIDNGKNKYSYENLINKPDMEIAKLTKVSSDELKKYRANTSLFSKEMRDIAIKEGNLKNTSTSTYLYCEDLGGDILITKNSYKHGAERFDENYVAICKALPQVLKNAIVVNELKPRNGNEGSYVLLGMAEGVDGYNVIRLVINKNTWQLNTYEELYAIKKKTSAKSLPNYAQTSNKGQMSSIISISDFLALVNSQKIGSSVLSKDVIERLDSERITDENITPSLKYSMPTDFKTNKYSYENLINKPDMEIASIADVSKAELNVYENNRDLFAKDMRKIAESAKNEHNTQNSTYLYNKDMDIDVLISKDAYKHGAARMSNNYIAVCKVLPQIFKNAVCVNELVARENSNGSKVLLGLAESDTDYVVVRMVVENRTWKLSDYDILYAVQKSAIKKEDVGIKPPRYTKKGEYVTSSVISISDFLALVNSQKIGSSVLSKDVIERLDSERITDENITPSLKYSMPTDFKTNKYSYENLINKPDMEIAGFDNVTPNELKRYRNNTYLFAKEMRDIATGVGNKNNTSNITYLYNKDLDINVMISRDSYKHSAARMTMNYISVCKVLPQIFENAVCVNELVARENSNGSKVLLGLAESDTDYVVVRMVVENRTWKLSDYDILYAVQKDAIKKEDAGVKAPALHQKVNTNTSSTISISDFLALVNSQKIGSSVLSKDVIEHLDSKRITDENITPSLKYSIKQTSKMSYNEQLELIENKGLNGSNSLYIGVPSNELRAIGFSNAPFVMNQSDYRKSRREIAENKHYSSHSVPYAFFEKMPQYFYDVAMLIDNGNKISIITEYQKADTKGQPSFVIVGVHQNQQMEKDTVNLIKSVYPLDDFIVRIVTSAEKGNLVIINKNKAEQILATIGVQPSEVSRIVSLAKSSLSQPQAFVNDNVPLSNYQIDNIVSLGKQLGRTVVVEDLRNRVVDGETVSPEGYIDGNGVIHINQYAKSPIAFIFKHELTHFCERSKLYSDFAKQVESSKLYKDWLCSKTGKKYLWDAEAAYKEQTLDSHTEIQSITDTNIQNARLQAEMIADFVGDFLFTDNGSEIASLISDVQVKQRHKIIQFLQDFVSYLKKKLSGNREVTLKLSRLEDSFNRMLSDATNGEYDKASQQKNFSEELRFSFVEYAEDGKGKYKSNFPKGTPKSEKGKRILNLLQNVWSKSPIELNIIDSNGNVIKTITAQFDPKYDETKNEFTDATKLMGGNRHGSSSEQRVTLDLADDYHKILSESKYNYSKKEIGKEKPTHDGVKEWHYFINEIYFAEYDSEVYEPYNVSINIKEKYNGSFVYSFSAEKSSEPSTQQTLHAVVSEENSANARPTDELNTPQTLHAAVNRTNSSANAQPDNILSDFNEKVNTDDMVTNNVSLSNSQIDNIVSLGRQLGRTVVVEDLRNRVVDGETVSPEGYIDGDGVIHINQYAKSPIAFIFKHELTHFCERSKLYSDFAKQVESSKLYKDWLCSKTGKKYLWDAEAVYKEQTLDSHTEIQSITDTNIQNARLQAEMIADFVGDFLFTDNGSGIASLISDVPVKQRPKIIQFLHDFVSYLKKKLSGNREVTLKLSRLEDSFNRMLSDATNGEYSDTKTDNIRYSIVGKKSKTADYSLLGEAIIMSHSGKSSEAIRKETGWYKGKDGKWRYYIPDNKLNIDKLVEFAKTSGETVLLGDCIEHKLLFDAYPELKNIKVEFKDLEPNNPGAYSPESDKIKLNNKYIGNTELLKDTLIHEMQHAIQKIESFAEGGNARRAYAYAVNLAYEIAHNSEQFKKITTKEEKLDYLHSIAQKLFNAKSLKEMVYNAYLNIYGEVEARQSENYRHFDENLLKLVEPNTTAAVVDFADEKEKFIENLTHIGYNKTEANNLIKKTGEISDQSGSIERTLRGDKPDSQETWGNNRGSVGRGSAEMALWSIRRNPIRISGNRRADKRIESTDKENERSSGNLGRTVQSDISGELLPGSRQHFTNGLGESKDIISDLNGEISDTVLSDDKIDSIIAVGKQLGRTVVVEDLRNRVVDGKTVSPEGYIDGDGVIHINQYAKSPIAFIFKHELTHFCERSKLYSDFAKRVESSKLYKDWLCYKTGKKYLWDAEAAYKAQTLDSHTEIQSITDTNIQNARLQAEMIADFVGDFLFTDNGRKIASLISDAPVKQRPKIIQFLQDFVSYLKKKLSGNREITFRLSMLEDSFNRMLSDATNGDYGDTKTDKEIAYCFVPCTDENIIKEAEIMEKDDALRPYIWRDLNVVRSPMGEWLYEINTSHYSFHARGDASTDKYFLKKFNATFEDASIKGYLGNFIRFKGLFEQCINLKAYKVVIEYNNENAVRLNHGERTFYIDKTLYDSFVENGDSEMKAQLLGEIQRALLLRNGTVDKNFDAVGYDLTEKHWQTFSKKLNRYMTTEEKNSNRPYEYLVNMVKERYRLNRKLLKSKRLNNVELKNYEKYFPSFEYDEIHLFDKHNNFISAREYSKKQSYDYLAAYPEASYTVDGVEVSEEAYVEKVEKERRRLEQERIAYETRTTDIDEQIVDEVFESNAKSDVLSKQNSEKLQEMLPDVVTASELEIHANPKIKIGDSGFFEQSFKETDGMLNELENASEREISGYDTAGRAIDKKLQKEFAKSVFKDINGNVASFFIHFKASDTVKDKVKSTAQFETFGGCLEGFFESRKKTPTTLYGTFVECYINSTSPYVTQHSSFDSFRILYELYENGKVSKEFYDKTLLLLKKSKRKDAGPAAEAVKDALRLMGCDSIVLVKSSKQSSVIPLSDDIVTVVSKNGLLASEEGELTNNSEQQSDGSAFYVNIVPTSKTRQDYSPIREKVNQKSGNTEKLKCLAEQLGSHVKKKGPQAMNRMRKVGSSGFFEKGKNIWRNGYLRLVQNIRANAKIALSDTDTAGRVIPDWIKRLPDNSLLKDGEGKPLSFFLFNRHGENRMRHNILGLHLGTFDNAVKRYDAENKAHPRSARHTIEEYYAAVKSPFYIGFEFDKFTPKKLAALLYEKGIIRRSEYNRFIKKKKVELNGSHNYNTRQIKRWLLNSGYDSIVYINQKNDVGALTLMVFDETALIPVSVNGLTTENNGNTVADSFEPAFLLPESVYENDKLSNFVEENNGYAVDLDKKRK